MSDQILLFGLCELWFVGFIWFWLLMCYYQKSLDK